MMIWLKFLQLLFMFRCYLMQQMLLAMGAGGAAANPPVFNAVTSSAVTNTNASGQFTLSHTTGGSNRALIVGFWFIKVAASVSSVTYGGTAMTLIGSIDTPDTGCQILQYKLSNPATGANNVVISLANFDPSGHGIQVGAVSFTNAHQTTANLTGTQATAAGTTTQPSINVASSGAEIVIDVLGSFDAGPAGTASVDAGQTQRWNAVGTNEIGAGSTEAGLSSVTMSWTLSDLIDVNWAIAGVSVKAP